jgi:putative addiction module component (TIGR02574 family)
MTSKADKLLAEALELPEEERIEVATRLFDSVHAEDADIDAAWREEIERRLQLDDKGEGVVMTWDEATRHLQATMDELRNQSTQ